MIKPFFSIITPIYNGEKFINRFYNSLISQDFLNWECLLIDDSSIDRSKYLLEEICLIDKRFLLLSTNNYSKKRLRTPSFARNLGLKNARGEFLCFLDIDDFWYPDKLKSDYYSINKLNSDILIGNYIKANQYLTKGYIKPRLNFLNIKFQLNFCNPFPILTTTIKKDIIGDIRFRAIHHED